MERLARILALTAVCLAGCQFEHQPIHLDKGFAEAPAPGIVVLPIMDVRFEKSDRIIIGRNVRDALLRFLEAKNYAPTLVHEAAAVAPADVNDLSAEELAALAPPGTGVFMLVQVDELEVDTGELGDSYEMHLSGVVVDPLGPAVLWRDRARGSSNLTGLLTVLARGSKRYEASVNACRSLMSTLPDGLAAPLSKRPGFTP